MKNNVNTLHGMVPVVTRLIGACSVWSAELRADTSPKKMMSVFFVGSTVCPFAMTNSIVLHICSSSRGP